MDVRITVFFLSDVNFSVCFRFSLLESKQIHDRLEIGRGKQGKLITSNSNINENLLNLYINNMINSDKGNPNKILVSNDEELPKAPNNNWGKYNHEMRILIDSKKIKQDYLIKILKGKLGILSNSLKNIKKVEENYDLENLTSA